MSSLPASRPPLTRMMAIHEALLARKSVNATDFGQQLEVSRKTIQRDIAFMRDQLGLPIEWDSSENSYYYNGTVDAFPMVQISEAELFALLVAERAVKQYAGTPYEEPLRTALRKLSQGLSSTAFISLESLEAPVSFKPLGVGQAEVDIFQKFNRAVVQSQEVHFKYRGISDKAFKQRRLQPWHLACVDNQWYCVGWDLMRQAKRTFALVRMKEVTLMAKHFEPPKDFDIREHLRDSLGIFAGNGRYTVKLEFDAFAAKLIREKTWHPSQQLKDLEDGRLRLTITLSDLWEVERWVLSWGGRVKVVGPAELRKRVHEHALNMVGLNA